MNKKKLVAILTLLCFMFTLMPVAAMADDSSDVLPNQQVLFSGNVASDIASPSAATLALRNSSSDATELTISSKDDLLAFAEAVNDGENFAGTVVKLGANIDLAGVEWTPIGGESVYFAGEFDGQGYAISNLTQTAGARMGLFGLIEKAYIHDLTMKNVNFTVTADNARVGTIAGNLQYWNVIENVMIDGITVTVNGNDGLIGTVAGYVWKSQLGNVDVKNAVFTVNGTGNVIGGHTGYGRAHIWDTGVTGNNANWLDGTVQTIDGTEHVLQNYWEDCDVAGIEITLNGTGSEAGGFFGSDTYNSHSNFFVNCHVTGLDVTCAEGTSQIVGGFVAWNNGTTSAGTAKGFDGCSATGTIKGANGTYGGFAGQVGGRACEYVNAVADVDITSTGTAGGFVGATQAYSTHKYSFTNCVAEGDVTGNVAGGFAGKNALSGDGKSVYVDYNSCEASGAVTGSTIAGGFIGEVNTVLPATNWNIVDGTGNLNVLECTASTEVSGSDSTKTAGLIGYFDGVANPENGEDAKEGNKVVLNLSQSTYTVKPAFVQSGETKEEDITQPNETIGEDGEKTEELVVKILAEETSLLLNDVVGLEVSANYDCEIKGWASDNSQVATVDASGIVKAVGEGSAIITVETVDGKTATCKITVEDKTPSNPPSFSSSGGGFSGVYNYPVTVSATGADVTLSDNYAVKGETVTITIDPDMGKKVDEVIVTDKEGKVISVTKVGDNKYSFTMPEGKVNVSVTTEDADYDMRIVMQINNKNIVVNNRTITNDVSPVIVGDRTLVPVRIVTELLGGTADWDEATRTVTLTIDGKVLKLVIDQPIPGFGTSATIINDRTYVPIRYVLENLGAEVTWIGETQQIVIEK